MGQQVHEVPVQSLCISARSTGNAIANAMLSEMLSEFLITPLGNIKGCAMMR